MGALNAITQIIWPLFTVAIHSQTAAAAGYFVTSHLYCLQYKAHASICHLWLALTCFFGTLITPVVHKKLQQKAATTTKKAVSHVTSDFIMRMM